MTVFAMSAGKAECNITEVHNNINNDVDMK